MTFYTVINDFPVKKCLRYLVKDTALLILEIAVTICCFTALMTDHY